jgi:hypothetical protein
MRNILSEKPYVSEVIGSGLTIDILIALIEFIVFSWGCWVYLVYLAKVKVESKNIFRFTSGIGFS